MSLFRGSTVTDAAAATPETDQRKLLVGLIGSGIQRSLTPSMQEEEARHHALRLHYQLIDLDRTGPGVGHLPALIAAARTMRFDGLNITYPCKQAVIPLLEELSDKARGVGAVNSLVFRDGKAIGHNTDGSGWAWGFRRALPHADLSGVVLLGAARPARRSRMPCCAWAPSGSSSSTATPSAPPRWRTL